MKESKKLKTVIISKPKIKDGHPFVTANYVDGSRVKLSRSERITLCDYHNPAYLENIRKAFSNPSIIADGFEVIKDGIVKFTYTK